MSPHAKHAGQNELRDQKHVIYRMIGSKGFLWVCGFLGLVFTTLVTLGAQTYIQRQAAEAPEFMAYKSDTDVLKTQIKILADTASQHTYQLNENKEALDDARQAQRRIFDAIKGVSNDVHAVDNHVSALSAQVADQAEAVKEIRQDSATRLR